MANVYLSLGSNLGDRLSYIQQAVSQLSMDGDVKIIKTSSFYETEPWGVKNQGWFLNAAVQIETNLGPFELLNLINRTEEKLGRNRSKEQKWHERTIDIDILFYDNQIISLKDKLFIPHKELHKRAFVLVPMLEINQDLIHPVFNKSIAKMYDELENPEDVFLYGTITTK